MRRTLESLIEGGYLSLSGRTFCAASTTYVAVAITQKGRDALAGGVALPSFEGPEAIA